MQTKTNRHTAWVRFRLPDESAIQTLEGVSRIWDGTLPQEPTFLMAPFAHNPQHPAIIITARGQQEQPAAEVPFPPCSTAYHRTFQTFHRALREKRFEKLVLSHPFKSPQLTAEDFPRLCQQYPHSLVYLLHTPQTGTWMGATPEVLLTGEGNHWQTMALAGTKADQTEEWDEKNRMEQAVVVHFIHQSLEDKVQDLRISAPYTMQSGNLYHLRTDFDFRLSPGHDALSLLNVLHPTPAVCGFPKEEAHRFILQNEGYDRQYYAGYLGPIHQGGKTLLSVNIRCARLYAEEALLFAGSGLMPDSTAEKEWIEVLRKSQALVKTQ